MPFVSSFPAVLSDPQSPTTSAKVLPSLVLVSSYIIWRAEWGKSRVPRLYAEAWDMHVRARGIELTWSV